MKPGAVNQETALSQYAVSIGSFLIMYRNDGIKHTSVMFLVFLRNQFVYMKTSVGLKMSIPVSNRNCRILRIRQ